MVIVLPLNVSITSFSVIKSSSSAVGLRGFSSVGSSRRFLVGEGVGEDDLSLDSVDKEGDNGSGSGGDVVVFSSVCLFFFVRNGDH